MTKPVVPSTRPRGKLSKVDNSTHILAAPFTLALGHAVLERGLGPFGDCMSAVSGPLGSVIRCIGSLEGYPAQGKYLAAADEDLCMYVFPTAGGRRRRVEALVRVCGCGCSEDGKRGLISKLVKRWWPLRESENG